MKEITVLSGKGGTGKTSISAALGSLAQNAVFCDNDVDAANLHLIFNPSVLKKEVFEGAYLASIDREKCSQCGLCRDYCRFDAISVKPSGAFHIDPFKCEGCRLCERICPEEAIVSKRSYENFIYISHSRFGKFIHASMEPGEENSGKLVTKLRARARDIARESSAAWIINDGPPGIGCAAISSLSGIDQVLLVTEPTKSGLHDLKRLVELIESFKIPTQGIINKYTINKDISGEIEDFLLEHKIPLIAKIPFDKEFSVAMTMGINVIEHQKDSQHSILLASAWSEIEKLIK